MEQRQDGFTIIEVILFLAISGLLLMGALIGVNRSINNTQFNDAVNSTASYLQREYAAVANGQNARPATLGCNAGVVNSTGSTAGMTNCVILGRLMQFQVGGSALSSRYIVGSDTATTATADTAAVNASNPTVINDAGLTSTFDVPWSIELDTMRRGSVPVNYVAIIKSPISERLLLYSFQGPDNITSLDATRISDGNLNQPVAACLLGDSRTGFVNIGAGQGQDIIQADLTPTAGVCP